MNSLADGDVRALQRQVIRCLAERYVRLTGIEVNNKHQVPRPRDTDLPFKISNTAIVILKSLPVVQCVKCPEYLIDDDVLRRVDEILARVDGGTELEIIRYAA